MPCSNYITDLSTAIFNDIGQPSDMPVAYIQTKLLSNAFLGKLNILTTNCHIITSGDIAPALDIDEQSIYSLMYQSAFYTTKINNLMEGTDIPFITVQDGDSRLTRVNVVDMARLYRDMNKQLTLELNNQVFNYRQSMGLPTDVEYVNIDNTWNGSFRFPNYTSPYFRSSF